MDLKATMSLDGARFINPLKAAEKALEGFKASMAKIETAIALLGVSFGAFKSAEAFTAGIKGVFETGKELKVLSSITGQTVADLVVLQKAFKNAGLAPEGVADNLIRMEKALGGVNEEGQPTAKVFEQLGLSIDKLSKLPAMGALEEIGKTISNLGTHAMKTAAIEQVFGRSGAEMLAVFDDPGSIQKAAKEVGLYGAMMQKDAGVFKQVTDTLEALHAKTKGFFVGFADKIAPTLLPLLQRLSNFNLVGVGKQFGELSAKFVESFQDGKISEIISQSLKVGFGNAANFLISTLEPVGKLLGQLGNRMFTEDFFAGIVAGFEGVGLHIRAVLTEALMTPLVKFQAQVEDTIDSAKHTFTGGSDQQDEALKQVQILNDQIKKISSQALKEEDPEKFRVLDDARDKLVNEHSRQLDIAYSGKPESLASREGRIREQGLGGDNSPSELRSKGTDKLKESRYLLAEPLKDMGDMIKDAKNRFSVQDIYGVSKEMEKLRAILASIGLKPAVGTESAAPGTGTYVTSPAKDEEKMTKELRAPQIEGDRFAKVGMFIGGQGGPANDYACRTARNTETIATGIQSLLQSVKNNQLFSGPDTARWSDTA